MTINYEERMVTPEQAARLLEFNTGNRKISPMLVDKYVREIKAGAWSLNGSSIVIDDKGHLLDGQHRLSAVVRAKTPVRMVIARGVSRDVQPTIDAGRTRSAADNMGMHGFKNANALQSTCNRLMALRAGVVDGRFSSREMMEFIEARPDLPEVVIKAVSYGNCIKLFKGRVFVPFFYLISRRSTRPDLVPDVMRVLEKGDFTYEGDPMHSLRERMIKTGRPDSLRDTATRIFYTMIAAWNARISGERIYNTKLRQNPVEMIGLNWEDI